MAYLNKIDINGRTYYLQHLTDGTNEAKLPAPARDDELLLRSQVVNSITSKDSQNGWRVPLSAAQGYSLNTKLNQEIVDREVDVDAEEARALAAEKVLTDNLAQEVTDRTNAVIAEQNRATGKENEISANLTSETNRAKAAEKTNADAIATEKARAEGAEAGLKSRIETMEAFFKEADIDASQEFVDTLKEIQAYITNDQTGAVDMAKSIQGNKDAITVLNGSSSIEGSVAKAVADTKVALESEIAKKVDIVNGKGLSTNDYTNAEKTKLEGIETGANKYTHPSHTACTSGLYKITVDEFGHVSSVLAVSKNDIVGLGIPAQDTTYVDATLSASGLLSAADKAIYDGYNATIENLQKQIDELKLLMQDYHPVTEPDQ